MAINIPCKSVGARDVSTRDQRPDRFLFVEDDTFLNHQITSLLTSKGYRVTSVHSGEQALKTLKTHHFDLILLDIQLPHINGLDLLRYIRSTINKPVIMLTAYAAEEHRITGLQLGADDYISKPCNFTELLLRIEAVLRRVYAHSPVDSHQSFTYKEISLNKVTCSVVVCGVEVELTHLQFNLLWTLAYHHGVVQNKPLLYQMVLDREYSQYDRSLDMHISRIRKRLCAAGMPVDRIKTLHGKGYLLQ